MLLDPPQRARRAHTDSGRLVGYVVAVVASAVVLGARAFFPEFFGEGNWFIQSHPAILVSAWVGGTGPGLVATALTVGASSYYFVPPDFAFPTGAAERRLTLTAAMIGMLISVLTGALRSSQQRLLEAQKEAAAAHQHRKGLLIEAERANRSKDEFLATLSHELRTPLNVILGWVHMLKKGKLSFADQQHAVSAIERNAAAQSRLVDNVLTLSEVITGRLSLNLEPVDLSKVASDTAVTLQPTLAAKQQQLHVEFEEPCLIRGDTSRLEQVLWSLLSNASKFTPEGGSIRLRVCQDCNHILCSVSDTGEGVESEFLSRMFEPFRQGDSSVTRRHGGLGLGLALVQDLVTAHGGVVSARSDGPGQGTVIDIRLPRLR